MMRLKLGLLALALALTSIGTVPAVRWCSSKEKEMATFDRVLVVNGVEYKVTLTRQGNALNGILPPQVQAKYCIKTFYHGEEWQQLLVTVNTFEFRDREGKVWVVEGASASAMQEIFGQSGAWYYTDFGQRPPMEFTAIATVTNGLITDGWPPVYS